MVPFIWFTCVELLASDRQLVTRSSSIRRPLMQQHFLPYALNHKHLYVYLHAYICVHHASMGHVSRRFELHISM